MDKVHTTKKAENRRVVWQMERNNREFKQESFKVFVNCVTERSIVLGHDALSLGTLTPTI